MKEILEKIDMLVELNGEFYITSSEKINVGDWFYHSDNANYAYIFRCSGLTDNTHLKVDNKEFFPKAKNLTPYGDWLVDYSYKIVASTKPLKGVKQLKLKKLKL